MTSHQSASRAAHEQGLARFLKPNRRARFLAMLANPRLRRDLRGELGLFERRLDPRHARPRAQRTRQQRHLDGVYLLLVQAGAPAACFVVSDGALDGREVSLREAVEQLMQDGAGFISCVPGRLGLYVGEHGSSVYVLARDA